MFMIILNIICAAILIAYVIYNSRKKAEAKKAKSEASHDDKNV